MFKSYSMKKYLLILSTPLILVYCNNNANESEEKADTIAISYSWEATLNDSGKLDIRKVEQGPDTLTPAAVIDFLNKMHEHIKLQFIKTSNDTLYVSIPDANYLTQQMGSSGPEEYFARVVYNLTEIPGIKYVNFDMQEGDHAGPGVMSRGSFKDE